jgi:hypothetical protein
LLNTGLIWRVGNGESVKIWGDRWIPYPSTYTIQSPPRILDKESKVSALIDEDTKWWNPSLVSDIFNADEAALIYNIPISPIRQHDTLVWLGTKNGDFSVKTAYHMAKVNMESSKGSSSNPGLSKQFWRKIWNINPGLSKQFWRKIWNIKVPPWLKFFCGRRAPIFSLLSQTCI